MRLVNSKGWDVCVLINPFTFFLSVSWSKLFARNSVPCTNDTIVQQIAMNDFVLIFVDVSPRFYVVQ